MNEINSTMALGDPEGQLTQTINLDLARTFAAICETGSFRLAASRWPAPEELNVLRALYEKLQKDFRADPDAARKLLGVGEAAFDTALDPVDAAALTGVANALLCADEVISKN